MIQLFVNDESLDLLAETSVSLELVSPAFVEDSGSYSLPFDLPATPKNRRVLEHPSELQLRGAKRVSFPARLFVGGIQVCEGVLRLTYPVGQSRIKCFLLYNSFADVVANKTLRDLTHLAPVTMSTSGAMNAHMKDTVDPALLANYEYCFLAVWVSEDFKDINQTVISGFGYEYFSSAPVCPFPYVHHLFRRCFESFSWRLIDRLFFAINSELRTLAMQHARAVAGPPFSIQMSKAVPNLGIGEFLKKICELFNLGIFFNSMRKEATLLPLKSMLSQSEYTDWSSKAAADYELTASEAKGYTIGYNWQGSDILHSKFFVTNLRRLFFISIYYVWDFDKTQEYREALNAIFPAAGTAYWIKSEQSFYYYTGSAWVKFTATFKGTAATTASISSPAEGDYWYITADKQYKMWFRHQAGGTTYEWVHYATNFHGDLAVPPLMSTKRTDAHTIEMLKTYVAVGQFDLVIKPAYLLSEKARPTDEEAEADTGIRLLFNRGYDTANSPVPLASSDIYNNNDVAIGSYSLHWGGANGLFENWHKDWLNFQNNTKRVTRVLRLEAADIFALDFTKKVRIGNIDHLLAKVSVTITMRGIQPAKVELYTIQ